MTIKRLSIGSFSPRVHCLRLCLVICATTGAVACAPAPQPSHQTVEYYRVNEEARAAKLAECENDPGALGQTPDCINARQAERQDMKSLRDLPPLNLPEAPPYTQQRDPASRSSDAANQPSNNR